MTQSQRAAWIPVKHWGPAQWNCPFLWCSSYHSSPCTSWRSLWHSAPPLDWCPRALFQEWPEGKHPRRGQRQQYCLSCFNSSLCSYQMVLAESWFCKIRHGKITELKLWLQHGSTMMYFYNDPQIISFLFTDQLKLLKMSLRCPQMFWGSINFFK